MTIRSPVDLAVSTKNERVLSKFSSAISVIEVATLAAYFANGIRTSS